MGQANDIAILSWERGYCFLINNPKCVEVVINNNDGFITVSSTEGTIQELFARILEILAPLGLIESQSPDFDDANTVAYYFNNNYTFAIKFSYFNVDHDLNSIDVSVEVAEI